MKPTHLAGATSDALAQESVQFSVEAGAKLGRLARFYACRQR